MSMNLKAITNCMGYQQISDVSSAIGLTVPAVVPVGGLKAQPVVAVIIAEGAAVRWRDDGTVPTASIGMPLAVGIPLVYDGDLTKIKFIEQTASAKLNISYYV